MRTKPLGMMATVATALIAVAPQSASAEETLGGFLQLHTNTVGDMGMQNLWLMYDHHATRDIEFVVKYNIATTDVRSGLKAATVQYCPHEGGLCVRAGQLNIHAADTVPLPRDERLIGGPLTERYMGFFQPGAEVSYKYADVRTSLAVVTGAGANAPDDNSAKDVIAGVTWNPGKITLNAVGQYGAQPDGNRLRWVAHAGYEDAVLFLDAHAAGVRLDAAHSWGIATMAGVKVSTFAEAAVGYDQLRDANADSDNVLRGQFTIIAERHVRAELMGEYSTTRGPIAELRLQGEF